MEKKFEAEKKKKKKTLFFLSNRTNSSRLIPKITSTKDPDFSTFS